MLAKYFIRMVAAALIILGSVPPGLAESTAEAIRAFGLIGTWSPDCAGVRSPPEAPRIYWYFRIGNDSTASLRESRFDPSRTIAWLLETTNVLIRYDQITEAKRSDPATLQISRVNTDYRRDSYLAVSLLGLSQSWFSIHLARPLARPLDGGLSTMKSERLARDGDKIRILDQAGFGGATIRDGVDLASGAEAPAFGKCSD